MLKAKDSFGKFKWEISEKGEAYDMVLTLGEETLFKDGKFSHRDKVEDLILTFIRMRITPEVGHLFSHTWSIFETEGEYLLHIFSEVGDCYLDTVSSREEVEEIIKSILDEVQEHTKSDKAPVIIKRSMEDVIGKILHYLWDVIDDDVEDIKSGKTPLDCTLFPEAHLLGKFLNDNRELFSNIKCSTNFEPNDPEICIVDLGELGGGIKCKE